MKNIILTLLFWHIYLPANARSIETEISPTSWQSSLVAEISPTFTLKDPANLEQQSDRDARSAIFYSNRASIDVKSGNYRQAINDYTQAIAALDRSNLNADESTVVVNNARKAGIYNARGLVKLQLGDKRGAIDDLTLASELFDEVGLMDVSERSLRIVKTIDR